MGVTPFPLPSQSAVDDFRCRLRHTRWLDEVPSAGSASWIESPSFITSGTDPAAHAGDPADAFDIVAPSLPGFGFSDRPAARCMNVYRVAGLWVELMTSLGYDKSAAQGGDIGAGVSTVLGLRHADRIIGLHLN